MTLEKLIANLKAEPVHTWFDLGLFLDRVRENREVPSAEFLGFFEDFKDRIRGGGIGFLTFYFGVDGVTMEIEKYATCFRELLPDVPIHYIAGEFYPEGDSLIHQSIKKHRLEEITSFDEWPLYAGFFRTTLERGSKKYNSLIKDFWAEVLVLVEKLGTYITRNNINLLYLINVCSNPGNISLALALVLLSEFLGIPVINNNHDFYWEGGARAIDIESELAKEGPRDHFFRNAHLGEVFSIIEMIYPWESRSWVSVNINENQSTHLIEVNGHNPANICQIGTAIDIQQFKGSTKRNKIKSFMQIEKMLAHYGSRLQVHTPQEVIDNRLVEKENPVPIVLGATHGYELDFVNNNILFLQPTRIMVRKKIEVDFKLIEKLFKTRSFLGKFMNNPQLTLTLLVTGPIPMGQYQYFLKLLLAFDDLLLRLETGIRQRVFMAFLFSEFDKENAIKQFGKPVSIPEIYNLASLILLPSETEGRGLPIIEATACGVPIFCRRYAPVEVYDAVIGKNLDNKDRLRVLEFERNHISEKLTKRISDLVFFPQNFLDDLKHNLRVVNKRFSLEALKENLLEIFSLLYRQQKPNTFSKQRVANTLEEYHNLTLTPCPGAEEILDTATRHYLPGFGRMKFMLFLKSLIDPSYFRVEEQYMRGMAMGFARRLVSENLEDETEYKNKLNTFYNAIDNIFLIREGETRLRHDHALNYRHRNKNYYPYQDFTYQELTGLISILYNKIVAVHKKFVFDPNPHFFTNWHLILFQMTKSSDLAIDDRDRLIRYLGSRKPFCLFPGEYIIYELELFVLQTVRAWLGLRIEEELTANHLKKKRNLETAIYIFCPEPPLGERYTASALQDYVIHAADAELKLVFRYGLCKIIPTKQYCVGIHIYQQGEEALKILSRIKRQKGFIIANDPHAPVMTDILDIDRFHIGLATDPLSANIMGIPRDSGYVQFTPAGVRSSLAYPTPVQSARSLSKVLNSDLFKKLCAKMGEDKVLAHLRDDAAAHGSPARTVLHRLEKTHTLAEPSLSYDFINGLYSDGNPWGGVLVKVNLAFKQKHWRFAALGGDHTRVTDYCQRFQQEQNKKIRVAWNGGYMLNPELVGKLGLPEAYIGSPLGMLASGDGITCPPLFNKPALLIDKSGNLKIQRVNIREGLSIAAGETSLKLSSKQYNRDNPENEICYYDLLYAGNSIPGDGRIILRLAGNRIKEVIRTSPGENVEIVPVGLTLSFPVHSFPREWENPDTVLTITLPAYADYPYAIEAGPLLLEEGKISINMEEEGWKTKNSIRTQAARLDFTDMRGPKIAVGLDEKDNLLVLAINGRIRESVGATHHDMATILHSRGACAGMGFDPGGSSTVVVDGRTLNISPYNSAYEKNVFAHPPEPRPVGNAVVGWLE